MHTILDIKNLTVDFEIKGKNFSAVKNISFSLRKGKTLGIVGESGAGKSLTCYSILKLISSPPTYIKNGKVLFNGIDLFDISEKALRKIRGGEISIIFQDPMTSLNPYMRIGKQLVEALKVHSLASFSFSKSEAIRMLREVGISDPYTSYHQYPHEFSGGMRQRIMIAMALITKPKVLIADEPTTALDVTVQAQIVDLLEKLKREFNMSILFISHDLGLISQVADDISVMYAGKIVELGNAKEVIYNSQHPYTRMLKESIPSINKNVNRLKTIPGSPPDIVKELNGCPFKDRCDIGDYKCSLNVPALEDIKKNHFVACFKK